MAELSKEEYEKAKSRFENDIKDVDEVDVEYASKKGQKKIESLSSKVPDALLELWDDIKTMVSLLTHFVSKKYKKVPWNVIAAVSGAIAYFVLPIDVIPDFIPVIGYLDDALVIKLALEIAKPDLVKFRTWKNAQ